MCFLRYLRPLHKKFNLAPLCSPLPLLTPSILPHEFLYSFLEWQPCHFPVKVFCSSRAIYLGFFQRPLWGRLVFLSPISNYFKIELEMAQLYDLTHNLTEIIILSIFCFKYTLVNHYSAIPRNVIIACLTTFDGLKENYWVHKDNNRTKLRGLP